MKLAFRDWFAIFNIQYVIIYNNNNGKCIIILFIIKTYTKICIYKQRESIIFYILNCESKPLNTETSELIAFKCFTKPSIWIHVVWILWNFNYVFLVFYIHFFNSEHLNFHKLCSLESICKGFLNCRTWTDLEILKWGIKTHTDRFQSKVQYSNALSSVKPFTNGSIVASKTDFLCFWMSPHLWKMNENLNSLSHFNFFFKYHRILVQSATHIHRGRTYSSRSHTAFMKKWGNHGWHQRLCLY